MVPLANVGWEHATGDLLGFAVVLPRKCETSERRSVLETLAKFAHMEKGEEAYAEVHFGEVRFWRLEHVASPVRASLRPSRWCRIAKTWASVAPVLLDRFPDHGDRPRRLALYQWRVAISVYLSLSISKFTSIRRSVVHQQPMRLATKGECPTGASRAMPSSRADRVVMSCCALQKKWWVL
jgi:CRISPR-associated protein Csb2